MSRGLWNVRAVVGMMLGIAALSVALSGGPVLAAGHDSKSLHTAVQQQLKRHDFQAAKDSAQELVQMEPDSFAAHVWLAKAYSGLKEYKNAASEYTAAMAVETDRETKARLLVDRAQAEYFAQTYSDAVNDFGTLIADGPTVDLYLQRASAYDALGKPELAIADYDSALKLQPANAEVYLKRALLNKYMKNDEAALADFNQAVKLRKSMATWRASFYRDKGQTNAAIEDFTSAIDANKGCGKAAELCNRALVYADLDHHRKAIKDLSDAIKIEPERAEFYSNRGSSYFGVSDWKRAIADFSEAIKRAPEVADNYYKRAEAEASDRQSDAALKDYDAAVKLQQDKKEAAVYLFRRGLVASDLNRHDQALQDLSKAVADDGANVEFWYDRGMEYESMEHWKEAEGDFSKVISMKSNFAPAYKHRALARWKLGNNNGALDDLKTSMQLYGDEKDMFGMAECRRMTAKVSK